MTEGILLEVTDFGKVEVEVSEFYAGQERSG